MRFTMVIKETTMPPFSGRIRSAFCTTHLAFALFFCATKPACAHLMPEKAGTLHVKGNSAFVVSSIPVASFHGIQTEADGRLTSADLERDRAAMERQFEAHFLVRDSVLGGQPVATWVMMPQDAQDNQRNWATNYVVVLHRVNFSAAPSHLTLFTDLFETSKGDKMLTLKVSRDKEVQMLVLKAGVAHFELLPGPFHLLSSFIATGIDHIVTGPDHLLFLLTIVIGAAGWRYWLGAISAFTAAHSITLTFSALGYVHIPSSIIEPGIAASIVVMALDNIFRPGAKQAQRVVLIFLCGLLHGLGFASSIADMGLDATHRILSLFGFNAGIEIGQFLFLGAIGAIFYLMRRVLPRTVGVVNAPKLASATAFSLGIVMLVQRIATVV